MSPNEAGKRRSETVSVRLDPKLRYLAEIAARKQRRTLSSFIEWAIEDSLNRVSLWEGANGAKRSVNDAANQLWDVDDADRFTKLAFNFPDLMTHQEQVMWKLIRENGYFWEGIPDNPDKPKTWYITDASLKKWAVRQQWGTLNAVARGEMPDDAIPRYTKPKTPDPLTPSMDWMDEPLDPEDDLENLEDDPK
jgi:predicted transcriptional regulator